MGWAAEQCFGSVDLGSPKMLAHGWWLWQSRKAMLANCMRSPHPRDLALLCLRAGYYLVRLLAG